MTMKSIYFYYDITDWNDYCAFLDSLNLDFYTYRGEKLDINTLLSNCYNGKWFVLIPKGIVPEIDRYGQIDEFPEAIIFHTSKKAGTILPAHISCNTGETALSVFKKIKKYFSSLYLRADSGKEFISKTCFENWLGYKLSLANCPKYIQISTTPEKFSFDDFVDCFRKKGYLICDSYFRDMSTNMSLNEDSYIIALPDVTEEEKIIGNLNGVTIQRHKRKGCIVYTFTLDYRHVYHDHKKFISLFEQIKAYCETN